MRLCLQAVSLGTGHICRISLRLETACAYCHYHIRLQGYILVCGLVENTHQRHILDAEGIPYDPVGEIVGCDDIVPATENGVRTGHDVEIVKSGRVIELRLYEYKQVLFLADLEIFLKSRNLSTHLLFRASEHEIPLELLHGEVRHLE